MMRTLRVSFLLFSLLSATVPGFAVTKNYNITITVKGISNQIAILAYYADDKKYIKDTLEFDANGVTKISGERELPDGVYLLAFPSRNYEMFDLILKEQAFTLSTDTSNMILNMQIKNSLENKALFEDLKFMVPLGRLNDSLRKVMKTEPTESEIYQKADKTLKDQAQRIREHRTKLVEQYPNTFYASLVRIMQDPAIPKELLNKDNSWKDTTAIFDHIREHYFDIINFNDSGFVRSPVYKNFILSYFENYVIPVPDTMIIYIDKLIERSLANKEQYQYVLSILFNQYANSPIMGYDAIMVHMADTYFLSGKTWWSDAENLKKLKDRVEAMKPTLIGKIAPNFTFQDSSMNTLSLYNLLPRKRFTMLVFWNSDCGHCQHEIPLLKQKYEDSLKTFDFQIVDISTEQVDSTFRKFIRKNTSSEWTTGWDPYGQSAFRHDYDVITTPKIFIIDRKRYIMGKGVGVNDLYKFLEFYSREPEATKNDKNIAEDNLSSSTTSALNNIAPPPIIEIYNNIINFKDKNSNNTVDAYEESFIKFSIINKGKGAAHNLIIKISATGNTSGIYFNAKTPIPVINAGSIFTAEIPITSDGNTQDGIIHFKVKVEEPNSLGSDIIEIDIPIKAFNSPLVKVTDYTITSGNGSSLVKKQPFDLQILYQNIKPGIADSITAELILPPNVFCYSNNELTNLGTLLGGQTKDVVYSLIVNENYTSTTIPIKIKLTEKHGKYAEDKIIILNLNQTLASNKIVIKASTDITSKYDIKEASLSSDVDKNIPSTTIIKSNTYALIIGNEDYSSYQTGLSNEVNVDYAFNDAYIFKEYCVKTLGIPEKQIKLLTNATSGQMKQGLAWINNLSKLEEGKAELIFYYSGHGLPDEISKEPYLIPVDISGVNINQGIRLEDVYIKLTEHPSRKITVFLDACFSGGARNQGLLPMKGIKIKPKEYLLNGNIVVFSSSSGDESSGVYREKQHGYLTYFLLKKIQESKGFISYLELANYLKQSVTKETALSGKIQTPQVNYSQTIEKLWGDWKINY